MELAITGWLYVVGYWIDSRTTELSKALTHGLLDNGYSLASQTVVMGEEGEEG